MGNEKTIEVLNTLITINNDRIEGYYTAAKETEEQDLKILFGKLSLTSLCCRQELSVEVTKLGGKYSKETNTIGKIYRVWKDVKAALNGKDRNAILSSCEYVEGLVNGTYEKAIKVNLEQLTALQQTIIKAQYGLLKADHIEVKMMRDSLVV